MYASLRDPRLPAQYLKNNQQDAVDEEMGLYDYGKAAATGLYHGAVLSLPEQYMRVFHRLGRWFGSDSMESWAQEKLDEYAYLRENDPFWQPDEKWMNSYLGQSLYNGFQSISSSAGLMLPGLALMPVTGGLSGGILGSALLGTATSAGTLAGIAEFDNFVDDAYKKFSKLNPNITREDMEDEHFWNAMFSGLAEGGLEFGGDLLGGKLLGILGKGTAGAVSAEALDQGRHIVSKLFRNSMRSMLAEVPSEVATAGIQDWLRESSGLDFQGRVKAMVQSLGPAMVSGGAFGAVGTAAKEIAGATHLSPAESKKRFDELAALGQSAELQDHLGDAGYAFYTQHLKEAAGMHPEQARAISEVAKKSAEAWARENGRDVSEWWADKNRQAGILTEDGWSDTVAIAQALVTPEASFDAVIANTSDGIWKSLTPDQQQAMTTKYGMVDEAGNPGIDKAKFDADLTAWIKDPKSVNADETTQSVFTSMRDRLLDSYEGVQENGGVRISAEAQGLFEAAFKRLEKKAPEAPLPYRPIDSEALSRELADIAANSPEDNEKIVDAFLRNTEFNFNPWTVGDDVKATFAAMDKALSPYMSKMLKRQSDTEENARAERDMKSNGYTAEGIDSLFKDVVGNEEGSFSYRLRKAMIYQTLTYKNLQKLGLDYKQNPTPQNGVALRMAIEMAQGVHEQMRGLRSESGRGLRVWRFAGKDNQMDLSRLNDIFENSGGAGMHEKIAKLLTNANGIEGIKKAVEASAYTRTEAMLIEHVTLGMLTNPATQIVNVAGNGLTLVQETFNRFVGEKMNAGKDGIVKGETGAMINGFFMALKNIRETWGQHKQKQGGTWNALKNIDGMQWGDASGAASIIDDGGTMQRQLTRENAQYVLDAASEGSGITAAADKLGLSSAHAKATHGLATAVEYYGRSLGLVSKGLLTADQFFKTVAYHMEMNARNFRRAKQAEAGGGDFKAAYDKLNKKALKADKNAAMEFAKKVTFQSDLGAIGKHLNKMRTEAPLLRLAIPFLKTPINILKYGAAHTPYLNRLVGSVNAELASPDPSIRQLAEARVMTGTMVWTAALGLAAQGMLTGAGPADLEKRKKLEATGWQPFSLKIGDSYYAIDRLDPAAFLFNTAASFLEIAQNLEGDDLMDASLAGLGAAIRTVTNRSYLQSVDNILNMVMNLESTEGQRAIQNMVGSIAVPASALSRTTARVIDPVAHETMGLFNSLRSNIPGFSMTVPERRNFLGEVEDAPEMWGPDHLSPMRTRSDNKDPVYAEIARLSQAGQQLPGTLSRTITQNGKKTKLNAEKYAQLQALAGVGHKIGGQTLKDRLGQLVGSGLYESASDEKKADMISDLVGTYRQAAKKILVKNDPEIRYLLGLD